MKTVIGKAVLIALTGSVAALASFAAQADVAACRALIGFDTTTSTITGGGAWNVVATNGDDFLSRNTIASCDVNVVQILGGGVRTTTTVILHEPMTQNECGVYNKLSSVDSKLAAPRPKVAEAFTVISDTIAKLDYLHDVRKLENPGYRAIRGAAVLVQDCIDALP